MLSRGGFLLGWGGCSQKGPLGVLWRNGGGGALKLGWGEPGMWVVKELGKATSAAGLGPPGPESKGGRDRGHRVTPVMGMGSRTVWK